MYCINCGNQISENAVFCSACGFRTRTSEVIPEDDPVQPAAQPAQEPDARQEHQDYVFDLPEYPAFRQTAPPISKADEPPLFFGKRAFAVCLAAIGLLAIGCGVFAGLFFSVV